MNKEINGNVNTSTPTTNHRRSKAVGFGNTFSEMPGAAVGAGAVKHNTKKHAHEYVPPAIQSFGDFGELSEIRKRLQKEQKESVGKYGIHKHKLHVNPNPDTPNAIGVAKVLKEGDSNYSVFDTITLTARQNKRYPDRVAFILPGGKICFPTDDSPEVTPGDICTGELVVDARTYGLLKIVSVVSDKNVSTSTNEEEK